MRAARPWPARYGAAALAVAVALGLQAVLIPLFGGGSDSSPFMIFFAAVIVAAWFGGLGPGLLAVGLSALLAWYFFLTPQFSLAFGSLGQALRLLVFAVEGAVISSLVGAMHSARRRAEASAIRARENEESLRESEEEYRAMFEFENVGKARLIPPPAASCASTPNSSTTTTSGRAPLARARASAPFSARATTRIPVGGEHLLDAPAERGLAVRQQRRYRVPPTRGETVGTPCLPISADLRWVRSRRTVRRPAGVRLGYVKPLYARFAEADHRKERRA